MPNLPDEGISGCREMMAIGTNGRKHWRPRGELTILRTRQRPDSERAGSQVHDMTSEHKKSRTLPMREHVGSSKSPLLGRRETPSKTRRHEDTVLPCAGISPSSKSETGKLGGFTCSFAEIRLK